MRAIFIAPILLALVACADQPGLVAANAPVVVQNGMGTEDLSEKTPLHCHKEASLGSNMLHTVCEAPQTEADRVATQQALNAGAPSNTVAHQGIGH